MYYEAAPRSDSTDDAVVAAAEKMALDDDFDDMEWQQLPDTAAALDSVDTNWSDWFDC